LKKINNKTNTILFLNGDVPNWNVIKKYLSKDDYIICADGGANKIINYNILPKIILGDFDSLTSKNRKYFINKGVILKKISEQETTDFEKALMYIVNNSLDNVYVFGAVSSRPDHTLNNFSVLKRYSKKLKITIIDTEFEILYVNKQITFDTNKGKTISLMAMPLAKGVSTYGLEYPLQNEDLIFGKREGTLNKAMRNKITISFKSGDLLLFKQT